MCQNDQGEKKKQCDDRGEEKKEIMGAMSNDTGKRGQLLPDGDEIRRADKRRTPAWMRDRSVSEVAEQMGQGEAYHWKIGRGTTAAPCWGRNISESLNEAQEEGITSGRLDENMFLGEKGLPSIDQSLTS